MLTPLDGEAYLMGLLATANGAHIVTVALIVDVHFAIFEAHAGLAGRAVRIRRRGPKVTRSRIRKVGMIDVRSYHFPVFDTDGPQHVDVGNPPIVVSGKAEILGPIYGRIPISRGCEVTAGRVSNRGPHQTGDIVGSNDIAIRGQVRGLVAEGASDLVSPIITGSIARCLPSNR